MLCRCIGFGNLLRTDIGRGSRLLFDWYTAGTFFSCLDLLYLLRVVCPILILGIFLPLVGCFISIRTLCSIGRGTTLARHNVSKFQRHGRVERGSSHLMILMEVVIV